jgi:N-dimethylarginine dimethylaminohydrolase
VRLPPCPLKADVAAIRYLRKLGRARCDYETIRRLDAIGYELIECPREEIDLFPTNAITVEPRRVIMNATAQKTKRLLETYGVEVITVEYDEVHKYGGGIRCNTILAYQNLRRCGGALTRDCGTV